MLGDINIPLSVMDRTSKHKSVRVSVQFSSVAQSCLTLCDPMNHSMPSSQSQTNTANNLT